MVELIQRGAAQLLSRPPLRYCGARPPEVKLVVDHVIPSTLGGDSDPSNLAAACEDCNYGKSASSPDATLVAEVNEDAAEWIAAMNKAAERQRARYGQTAAVKREREALVERCCEMVSNGWPRDEQQAQEIMEIAEKHTGTAGAYIAPPPDGWQITVRRFALLGLTEEDLYEASSQAFSRPGVTDVWRYFCGIAWNLIRQRQEWAATTLHGDAAVRQESPPPLRWLSPSVRA